PLSCADHDIISPPYDRQKGWETGFMFPSTSFDPARVLGTISLLALAAAVIALYVRRLAGFWRWVYVVDAMLALYLNCFVGVVQAFQKLPFLEPLAPTQ